MLSCLDCSNNHLKMIPFEMLVRETFRIKGWTLFLGFISPDTGFIRPCDCEVVVNDKVITRIHIEGEVHPLSKDPSRRAIGTREIIDLESLELGSSNLVIRSIKT
jgi:hypothetical protein